MLTRANGPECPICGCRDAEILKEPKSASWFAAGRARCKHCGRVFNFVEEEQEEMDHGISLPAIKADPTKCPQCGGKFRIYRTVKPVQYRKCVTCGKNGTTVIESAA